LKEPILYSCRTVYRGKPRSLPPYLNAETSSTHFGTISISIILYNNIIIPSTTHLQYSTSTSTTAPTNKTIRTFDWDNTGAQDLLFSLMISSYSAQRYPCLSPHTHGVNGGLSEALFLDAIQALFQHSSLLLPVPFLGGSFFSQTIPNIFYSFSVFFFMGIIFLFKWPREEKCSRFTGFLWFGFYLRRSIAPLPHGNLSQFSLSIVVLILYLLLGLVARRDQMSFSGCVLPRIVGRQMSRVCHRAAMVV